MNNHYTGRLSLSILYQILRVWITVGIPIVPASAWADDYEHAKMLFDEGVDAFLKEDYKGALSSFEASYRLNPKSTVLFNIAMCYKALGDYPRSVEVFSQYLREVQSIDPMIKDKIEAAMAEMIPFIEAEKQEESTTFAELPDIQSPVTTESTAQAHKTNPAESAPLLVQKEKLTDEEGPSLLFVGGWTCLALGLGAGIAGIYFTATGIEHESQGNKLKDEMIIAANQEEYVDYKKKYNYLKNTALPRDSAGAIIGYTLAGALVTTGIVLLLLDPSQSRKDTARASITPWLGGLNVHY